MCRSWQEKCSQNPLETEAKFRGLDPIPDRENIDEKTKLLEDISKLFTELSRRQI